VKYNVLEPFLSHVRDQYLFPLTKLVTHTSFGDSRPMKNCGAYRGGILKQGGL
jgi:hypothetical protein